jgi:hypothetical protein
MAGISPVCAIAHGARHPSPKKLRMNTQSDAESLSVVAAKLSELWVDLKNAHAASGIRRRRNVPILDVDFDDIVSGYSDGYSWYEP